MALSPFYVGVGRLRLRVYGCPTVCGCRGAWILFRFVLVSVHAYLRTFIPTYLSGISTICGGAGGGVICMRSIFACTWSCVGKHTSSCVSVCLNICMTSWMFCVSVFARVYVSTPLCTWAHAFRQAVWMDALRCRGVCIHTSMRYVCAILRVSACLYRRILAPVGLCVCV
jgi:hypothetical protein